MLLAPLICCSSGAAIELVTTSALAPGKVAETSTCGGTICGYCEIGNSIAATAPANIIISEMTVEKTGRSIKKLNMLQFPPVERIPLPMRWQMVYWETHRPMSVQLAVERILQLGAGR